MRYLVTVADYEKCVAAHACDKLAANVSRGSDLPAVQVSWRDATAYAAWLSARTRGIYRVPTDLRAIACRQGMIRTILQSVGSPDTIEKPRKRL